LGAAVRWGLEQERVWSWLKAVGASAVSDAMPELEHASPVRRGHDNALPGSGASQ